MTAARLPDELAQVWLYRALSSLAPALRELADEGKLKRAGNGTSPPRPEQLRRAADVIEQAASCLSPLKVGP